MARSHGLGYSNSYMNQILTSGLMSNFGLDGKCLSIDKGVGRVKNIDVGWAKEKKKKKNNVAVKLQDLGCSNSHIIHLATSIMMCQILISVASAFQKL